MKYKQKIRKNITLYPYLIFLKRFRPVSVFIWIYLAEKFGSYAIAMSYLSLMTLCTALFDVPTGILSDKIGRKKTLILATMFACIESIVYILADISEANHIFYIIAFITIGISYSLYNGTDDALIYESISKMKKEHKFHHAQGKFASAAMLAFAISALVGGIVAEFSFLIVFIIQLLIQISTLVIALFLVESKDKQIEVTGKSKRPKGSLKHLLSSLRYMLKNYKLRNLALGRIIEFGLAKVEGEFRQVFLKTFIPIWVIGTARFLRQLIGTTGYWFSGKIIDKFGSFKIVVGCNVFLKSINFLAVLMENIFTPFMLILSSFIRAPYNIAYLRLSQQEFTKKERATMSSIVSLFVNIVTGIVSILAGYMADITSPKTTIILIIIGGLGGTYFYNRALRK